MSRDEPRVHIDLGGLPIPAIGELRRAGQQGPEQVRAWIKRYGKLSRIQAQLLSRRDMDRILADIGRQAQQRFGPKHHDKPDNE
jgi:hypothetical protein